MKLRYTPRAAAELEEVLAYIEERSPVVRVKRRAESESAYAEVGQRFLIM